MDQLLQHFVNSSIT